jgi:hypothetical protein
MAGKLTDEQLSAIVSQQIDLAKTHDKNSRKEPREKAIDYFMGEMDKYVPPEANRSRVVSHDVADTIGWMHPDLMRVFTASDRMAIAEPESEWDAQFSDQVTDGLNYVFWKDNKGYETVYNSTHDALLVGNGIIKTYYDATPVYTVSFHSGLTEDQLAMLVADDNVEVLQKDESEGELTDPDTGVAVPVLLYDVKIRRLKADGKFTIEAIPPEEFLQDGDAISTDEAAFTAHWQKKTRSDLVAMGYDKDTIWTIPEATKLETAEEQARNFDHDVEATDKSMELVDYYECFVRIDVDGDGEAELCRVCYAGNKTGKLLDWEVWEDEHPFDDIPCRPVPHRWEARSIADDTIEIQDVKTVLTRQFLNNTYWVNNPQRFAQGKIKNPDALDNPVFGQTVFGEANTTVTPLPVPYIGDKALMALTHFDEVRQARTGVGRQSMALDPEVLQNQTATASNNNRDAARSQVELIARNMAEWGFSKVFRKLMRLMIKHQKQPRKLMLNAKKVVTIDPRYWNADMKVTINTGLGTGSRDRDMLMLQQVLGNQVLLADRFMASGAFDDAIDMLPKIIETMEKIAESAGIRNPEDFYPEYTEEKVARLKQLAAQPKPNPKVEEINAKAQADMQLKQVDAQVSEKESAAKAQVEIVKNQAQLEGDLADAAAQRENAIIIETLKQDREDRRFFAKLASDEQLERERMAHQAQVAAQNNAARAEMAANKPSAAN